MAKTKVLGIRLTDDERERCDRAAESVGKKTGEWARDRLLASGIAPAVSPKVETLPTRGPLPPAPPGALRARVPVATVTHITSAKPSSSAAYQKARADLEAAIKADCKHPVTRRLGNFCAACGKTVS